MPHFYNDTPQEVARVSEEPLPTRQLYAGELHAISLERKFKRYPDSTPITSPSQLGGAKFISKMTQEHRERHLDAIVIKMELRARIRGLSASGNEYLSTSTHFTPTTNLGRPESQTVMLGVNMGEHSLE